MAKRDTPFGWTCPFCGRVATVGDADYRHWFGDYRPVSDAVDGRRFVETHVIECPNPECKRATIWVSTANVSILGTPGEVLQEWRLIPSSDAKVFPDYVPADIRETYIEACLIRDLSPRASATLARRTLQGMLRNFFDATKKARVLNPKNKNPTLADEINAVEGEIDPLTWGAIHAVRSIGNIGAHMEEDVNLIVDVHPDEAQLLITLVEQLIGDWYVSRYERKAGRDRIVAMAKVKQQERKPKSASSEDEAQGAP